MCIAIFCKPSCYVMNFDDNLIFLIKLFSLHDQKVVTKTKIFWKQKELLRWNKNAFLVIFKGLSVKLITQFFLEGKNRTLILAYIFTDSKSVISWRFGNYEDFVSYEYSCYKYSIDKHTCSTTLHHPSKNSWLWGLVTKQDFPNGSQWNLHFLFLMAFTRKEPLH